MFLASQVWFHHILDVEQTATVVITSLWVETGSVASFLHVFPSHVH